MCREMVSLCTQLLGQKGVFVVKKLYKLKYSISSVFCVNLKYLDVWEGSLKISNIIENQKFWINILILSS